MNQRRLRRLLGTKTDPSPLCPTGNGATCLTHCDGSDTKAEIPLIVSSVQAFSEHAQCGR